MLATIYFYEIVDVEESLESNVGCFGKYSLEDYEKCYPLPMTLDLYL